MLARVYLTALSALLVLAVPSGVIRAQEGLPDGAFAYKSSPDELTWRPFFFVQWATVYRGPNGYAVDLLRLPADKETPPNLWHFLVSSTTGLHSPYVAETDPFHNHAIDAVMRIQSGTLYLAFSTPGKAARGELIAYHPYGPGSIIGVPTDIEPRMFAGGEDVVIEVTHPRNIPH